jgi:hypothetical protein
MSAISFRKGSMYVVIGVFAISAATLIFHFCRFAVDNIKCWSSEYGPSYYLAQCRARPFGEYETGAIYYGLESGISDGITNAQVIFLGSSKLQQAFSTQATNAYFAKQNIRFYVLGLAGFVLPLFKTYRVSPSLLIINADPFFAEQFGPGEPEGLMSGGVLRTFWNLATRAGLQRLQRAICPTFSSLCSPTGDEYRTIYRSGRTGQWKWQGSFYPEQSIPFNELLQDEFSDDKFATAVDFGKRFLREINIDRGCIVLTGIPNNLYDAPAIASRLAQRLGTQLILPKVEPLFMLDDYHLNFDTAERWSVAFFNELTPVVERCISKRINQN